MRKEYDFDDSIKMGKDGEEFVKTWLMNLPNVTHVEDVSDIPEYRKQDIDFKVHMADGTVCTMEVKTDGYRTGNIFYEYVSNTNYHVQGCMNKCKAKYLLYYFSNMHEIYILNMAKYREWFETNRPSFDEFIKTVRNKDNRSTNQYDKYTTIGYAIPLKLIRDTHRGMNPRHWKRYYI